MVGAGTHRHRVLAHLLLVDMTTVDTPAVDAMACHRVQAPQPALTVALHQRLSNFADFSHGG